MQAHTVLRTQILNVLRKWYQNQGSTVFILTSPKDRNCEVCLRTKMTRAHGRRRIGEGLLRAEKFGDLITAGHKVFNEGCESRDNHRYAVVVQDLATQWIQSYQCKTEISHETEKSFSKFWEPSHKPKVIYTDKSLEFGRACEVLSWNHRISTLHRSERSGVAEEMTSLRERYAESRKELLQCCYNQDWMKSGGRIPWNASAICEMSKTSWQMGKLRMKDGLENHSKVQ